MFLLASSVIALCGFVFLLATNTYQGQLASLTTSHQRDVKLLEDTHRYELQRMQDAHLRQLTEVRERLDSIHRAIEGCEYFDSERLTAPRLEKARWPRDSHYFPDDRFCAPQLLGSWHYEKLEFADFIHLIYGNALDPENMYGDIAPVHFWRGGDEMAVTGNDLIARVLPFVCVQRFDVGKLHKQLYPANGAVPTQSRLFTNDLFNALLADELVSISQSESMIKQIRSEMVGIEKHKNKLYWQQLVTLSNATVGGELKSEYYVTLESFVIIANNSVYSILISTPSGQPLPVGESFRATTQWLESFAIITD